MLGTMDKLILEGLESKPDFVESIELILSLRLKNEPLTSLAIDAISELVEMKLIAVINRTSIKITSLGKEILEKEGRLNPWERSTITK